MRIDVPRGGAPRAVRVELNGKRINDVFRVESGSRADRIGEGTGAGRNVLEASDRHGGETAHADELRRSPAPSSPARIKQPFICQTA